MATSENPHIDPTEIESARLDMTEAAFNQEYLALFVNWEGSVFRRVGEAATVMVGTKPQAFVFAPSFAGPDQAEGREGRYVLPHSSR